MSKFRSRLLAGALIAAIPLSVALAAGQWGNWPPAGGTQYPTTLPLTGNETIPMDTNLPSGLNPASEIVSVNNLLNSSALSPTNLLIGGDAANNLFQRATTGSSVTTTLTYGGPDRWAYWSGTNTAMTVSQDTTAGDLSTGFPVAFKMARTAAQTGVVQMCMAQEVETALVKASGIAGSTAELSFSAVTGANFSPTAANMTAYIITGTGTNQGLAGSNSMAFGLNAGGGGSGGWTGQANATAAVISLGGVSTAGRYAAVAAIPAATTEIGVALCWTPVGTAGTNDYVAFSGIQLKRNPQQSALASATVGYSCASGIQCSHFERRPYPIEAELQFRYFYKVTEGAAITQRAPCAAIDVTHTNCIFFTPTTMRQAPVFSGDGGFTAGFATPTTTSQATLGNCTALALAVTVTNAVASPNSFIVTCTAGTVPAAGVASFLYDNNGAGVIKASAEL